MSTTTAGLRKALDSDDMSELTPGQMVDFGFMGLSEAQMQPWFAVLSDYFRCKTQMQADRAGVPVELATDSAKAVKLANESIHQVVIKGGLVADMKAIRETYTKRGLPWNYYDEALKLGILDKIHSSTSMYRE